MPDRIAPILQIALILAEYGRHLAATIEHRALWRGFATIAQFFGTATLAVILPHIHRGIMRAMALERMLLERAKRGRDLVILPPRVPASRPAQSPAAPHTRRPAAAPQPAEAPSAREPKPPLAAATAARRNRSPSKTCPAWRTSRSRGPPPPGRPDGRRYLPRPRRVPKLCLGAFWTMLFDAIHFYRGSLTNLVRDMRRREKQLDRESWKHPNLGFPEQTAGGRPACAGVLHRRAAGGSVPSRVGTGHAPHGFRDRAARRVIARWRAF